jgi:hypothetical protein
MAINPSNSNAINIVNLPNAQLAVGGDFLIIQTPNGTQKINFTDFNVVRTDVFGNATVIGDLTGNRAFLTEISTGSISARNLFTTAGQGINVANGFYNRFTFQDGLILSADQNTTNDPVYTAIVQGVLPSLSAFWAQRFKFIADQSCTVGILPGQFTGTGVFPGYFGTNPGLSYGSINSAEKFTIGPTSTSLSGAYISSILQTGVNNADLTIVLTVPLTASFQSQYKVRALATYS